MRPQLLASVAVSALLAATGLGLDLAALPADANPIPYVNSPLDTPQALVNTVVVSVNAVTPAYQYPVTCSGNTTGNCTPGIRIVDSVTNLTTTSTGNLSAAVTVTDSAVTAASDIFCTVENYTGNGTAQVANITANAGNFTFQVQNTGFSAALSATVPVHCMIYN